MHTPCLSGSLSYPSTQDSTQQALNKYVLSEQANQAKGEWRHLKSHSPIRFTVAQRVAQGRWNMELTLKVMDFYVPLHRSLNYQHFLQRNNMHIIFFPIILAEGYTKGFSGQKIYSTASGKTQKHHGANAKGLMIIKSRNQGTPGGLHSRHRDSPPRGRHFC